MDETRAAAPAGEPASGAGTATRPYTRVDLACLVPEISVGAFRSGEIGSCVVLPEGEVALVPVTAYVMSRGEAGDVSCAALPQSAIPIQRPINMPSQRGGLLETVRHPALRIARASEILFVPGGIAIKDDHVLTESFSATWEAYQHRHLRGDPDGRWHLIDRGEETRSGARRIDGPVLYLDHQHIAWFGHVILDVLTRLWAHEYCVSYLGVAGLKVLIGHTAPGYLRGMLAMAGLRDEDIIAIDGPALAVQAILATKSIQIQEYVSPPAIRTWSRIASRSAASPLRHPSRLYVSRRLNPTRALREEEALEAIFRRHGFVVLYPEHVAIEEQIGLFANATLIAGCSGSNLFNLGFCQRIEGVMMFVSPLLIHYSEQFLLAGKRDARMTIVVGYADERSLADRPGNVHADWHVGIDLAAGLISEWLRGFADRA